MTTTNETVNLDGKKLKHIAESSHTAKVLMNEFASRERDRSFTDIARVKHELLKSGERIKADDFMKTWEELEKAGIGSIIHGRNGKTTRFAWNYSLKTVGQAALEGKNLEAPKMLAEHVKRRLNAKTEINNNPVTTVYIPLRDNLSVTIKLPQDLTEKEMKVIIDAIKSVEQLTPPPRNNGLIN